jgi:23S rRNA C2498 (ribose-2'-O)-methylase RlmM
MRFAKPYRHCQTKHGMLQTVASATCLRVHCFFVQAGYVVAISGCLCNGSLPFMGWRSMRQTVHAAV